MRQVDIARVLSGLETATAGTATLGGTEIGRRPIDTRPVALRRQLQMVFQNPDSTLNPSHTAGHGIVRALQRLRGLGRAAARREAERLFTVVKLPPEFVDRKPHQLSGGQRQRVAIARALAGNPNVIVADEPVSALDVSVQAAIVNLLSELQADRGATLVFISHDLSVVRYLADHVAVMYLGQVVEFGPVEAVFTPPYHPYTEALLSAVPIPTPRRSARGSSWRGDAPERDGAAGGLPVQHALSPESRPDLRRHAAARAEPRARPSHRLPHPRRRAVAAADHRRRRPVAARRASGGRAEMGRGPAGGPDESRSAVTPATRR